MNEQINDGGTAFPTDCAGDPGISTRDYFAAKAMQGMIAGESDAGNYHEMMACSDTAERAYEFADAMLAQREKGRTE